MLRRRVAAALLLVAGSALPAASDQMTKNPPCQSVKSIGVAHMTKDGVITLRIRSLPPPPIAEAELRYAPDDQSYVEIKRHLGGIAPGEWKAVRPWC